MMNHHPDLNAPKHFLADYDDLPDLSVELQKRLITEVAIIPATWRPVVDEDDLPHDVLATTWQHLNQDGVLSRERFYDRLREGLDSLAGQIIQNGDFQPYPMTRKPAVTEGNAYHDYSGSPEVSIDVRIIITYGQIPLADKSAVVYGLTFHLVTLVAKGSHNI